MAKISPYKSTIKQNHIKSLDSQLNARTHGKIYIFTVTIYKSSFNRLYKVCLNLYLCIRSKIVFAFLRFAL